MVAPLDELELAAVAEDAAAETVAAAFFFSFRAAFFAALEALRSWSRLAIAAGSRFGFGRIASTLIGR